MVVFKCKSLQLAIRMNPVGTFASTRLSRAAFTLSDDLKRISIPARDPLRRPPSTAPRRARFRVAVLWGDRTTKEFPASSIRLCSTEDVLCGNSILKDGLSYRLDRVRCFPFSRNLGLLRNRLQSGPELLKGFRIQFAHFYTIYIDLHLKSSDSNKTPCPRTQSTFTFTYAE